MLMRLTLLTALVTAGLALATAVLVWDRSDSPNPPNINTTETFARSRMVVGMPLVQYQHLSTANGGPLNGFQDEQTGCIYLATASTIRPLQGPGGRPACVNGFLRFDPAEWSIEPRASRARLRDRSNGRVRPRTDPVPVNSYRSVEQVPVQQGVPVVAGDGTDDAAGDDRVSVEGERGTGVPDAGQGGGVPVLPNP